MDKEKVQVLTVQLVSPPVGNQGAKTSWEEGSGPLHVALSVTGIGPLGAACPPICRQ
jgi:hypothetical protein